MQITEVDPYDDDLLARWHDAYRAGAAYGRVEAPIWTLAELAVSMREDPDRRAWNREPVAAVNGDTVTGAGLIEYPVKDNLAHGEVWVFVPPHFRNQGIGGALMKRALARFTELGRTSVGASVFQPIGQPDAPGVSFLTSHGFTRRNVEMRRNLDLPVPEERLDALLAKASAASTGYRVESWEGATPDAYAEQYATLKSLLSTQAPLGELDYEPEVWDVERLRNEETMTAKQGRRQLTAVAVAPDGSLAGHTQLSVPPEQHGRAFQWDTLVLPEHRGHQLGTLLKVTNLRNMTSRFPDRRRVITWNAVQNGPMNAVNDALGFVSVEATEEWQRDA